ncbi:MAG TPA: transketolase [Anaerolineaceae bacterium]|nr:transketolase [Anaerolineaceae bacterium]
MNKTDIEQALNTIRFFSADGVQLANSGHTGMPMGAAALAYTLYVRQMNHNPKNPNWINRDRFVLSGGHASMLLYTILHLTGYDISIDDLKQFRQYQSITPGHPEWGVTPGVDTSTGPLGQGFATGVGMAIAEAHLAATFNKPGFDIVNHYTYAIVTDGDMMEGISSEAASLAGTLKLGKLIYLYDSNDITIEGRTDIALTEDVAKRFEAYNWHVQTVEDGNDVEAIDKAIEAAKLDPRPSLIICKTIIGYGLPNRADTSGIHGSPAGWDELNLAKENAGIPTEPLFYITDEILAHFREQIAVGAELQKEWNELYTCYKEKYPDLAKEFERRNARILPENWDENLPVFEPDKKGLATRVASWHTIQKIADALPEVVGGSADLAPSNNTWMDAYPAFGPEQRDGRNIHYGVREIAMAAIGNGLFVHGGIRPFNATFLVFSDYLRGSLRVSALSNIANIFVLTHDSIGVGEDGPTHQPVETIMSLRLMPNLNVIRPADANETVEAWKAAIEKTDGPTALILSRQNIPTIDRQKYASAKGLHKGAYVLYKSKDGTPDLIIIAAGSEVTLALDCISALEEKGLNTRVVSMPCWELFEAQDKVYKDEILPPSVKNRISLEAGQTLGWERWVGQYGVSLGVTEFGLSAPGDIIFKEFGFTVENVISMIEKMMKKNKG